MTSQGRAFAQLRRNPVLAIECIGRRSCGEERGEGRGEREEGRGRSVSSEL
jgi:hypothetical protein